MTPYEVAKAVHVSCAALSATGFVVRGLLMLNGSPLGATRFARIAPHVIDTALLIAAVAMLAMLRLDPRDAPWLIAKISALLAYIILGAIALRHGRTPAVRATAFATALLALGYILAVAVTRSPSAHL